MPKIQPYLPQTNAAAPPTPEKLRLDQATGTGKGLIKFGTALEEAGSVVQKAQDQSDVSKLNAHMALARSDAATELHQKTQDGTLDTDDFKQSVQDRIDKIADKVGTRAGQNYFTEAAARLQGDMLNQAAVSQATLKGAEAKENYGTALNANSSTLMNDPHTFLEVNKQQAEGIDALVASGGLPAKYAGKFKTHSQGVLAESAVRGYMQQDPDLAKQQLSSGQWDPYIDGNTKFKLLAESNQAINGKRIEQERIEKAKKDQLKSEQTASQNKFLNSMNEGQLSTKDILSSNLDAFGSGSKEQFLQMLQKHTQQKSKTDPYVFNDLFNRIHAADNDPHKIHDENELNKYLGNGVDLAHLKALRNEFQGKGTIEGDANNQLKKSLVQEAYQKIAKPDPFTKLPDPQGAEQYRQWLADFSKKWQQGISEGKKAIDMAADPKSQDYLGGNMQQYVRTPEQIMQDLVGQKTKPPAANEQMVDVVSPEGMPGKIPQSKVDQAKARGFKVGK